VNLRQRGPPPNLLLYSSFGANMAHDPSSRKVVLSLSIEEWVAHTSRLLQLEQDAEVVSAASAVSRKDTASLSLVVDSVSTGLLARTVLSLTQRFDRSLPQNDFSSGDIVGLNRIGSTTSGSSGDNRTEYDATGVVVSVTKAALSVALDDKSTSGGGRSAVDSGDPFTFGDMLRIDKLADVVSFQRMTSALHALRDFRHGPAGAVIRILFSNTDRTSSSSETTDAPTFHSGPVFRDSVPSDCKESVGQYSVSRYATWSPISSSLNSSQVHAVESALRARDLCMIHGPPGTGKTTALVEYIAQEVLRGNKVVPVCPML
jgi:ATP-dependent RNA/DNA helicase IGHMBP2